MMNPEGVTSPSRARAGASCTTRTANDGVCLEISKRKTRSKPSRSAGLASRLRVPEAHRSVLAVVAKHGEARMFSKTMKMCYSVRLYDDGGSGDVLTSMPLQFEPTRASVCGNFSRRLLRRRAKSPPSRWTSAEATSLCTPFAKSTASDARRRYDRHLASSACAPSHR